MSAPPASASAKTNGPAKVATSAAAAPAAAATPTTNRKPLLIGAVAGLVVLLVATIVVWWKVTQPPLVNESTPVLIKFAYTSRFDGMRFDDQKRYMLALEDRGGKEIEKAFAEGKVTEAEARKAKELAWFGQQFKHIEKYYSLPAGHARQEYVRKEAAKKVKKENKSDTTPKPGKNPKKPTAAPTVDVDVDRDETSETERPKTWPADVQDQWNQYREAYKQEKKALEEAEKAAKQAAKQAATPATNPAKTGG
jgi:hypothetical protein